MIQAREAPVVLIFRRGPTRYYHLVKWNTDTDVMEHGAWYYGKLYPERCDLSPDGTKFVYFTLGSGVEPFPVTFTAISKPPWLTCLCAWDNFDMTYFGGGHFPTNSEVWVNKDFHADEEPLNDLVVPPGLKVDFDHLCWEVDWLEQRRLDAEGWEPIVPYPSGGTVVFYFDDLGRLKTRTRDPNWSSGPIGGDRETEYFKRTPAHDVLLVCKRGYWYGSKNRRPDAFPYPDSPTTQQFSLRMGANEIPMPGIFNADWDKQGRLIFVKAGAVHASRVQPDLSLEEVFTYDLNPFQPKRTKSPEWARQW